MVNTNWDRGRQTQIGASTYGQDQGTGSGRGPGITNTQQEATFHLKKSNLKVYQLSLF